MKYDDENWIKVYTRDTAGWVSLSWQARGLGLEISRRLPKHTGELSLGRRGLESLAALVRAPWSEIEPFVRELIEDGRLEYDVERQIIRDPQHVERQNAIASSAERQRRHREAAKAAKPARPVTRRNAPSRGVTRGNAESPIEEKEKKRIEEKEERESAQAREPAPAPTADPIVDVGRVDSIPDWVPESVAACAMSTGEKFDIGTVWTTYQASREDSRRPIGAADFRKFLGSWASRLKADRVNGQRGPRGRPGHIVQSAENREWELPKDMP